MDTTMPKRCMEIMKLQTQFLSPVNYNVWLAVLASLMVLAFPTGYANAQSHEDYYNNRIKQMKACKGDLECARRVKSQSGAKAREILQIPTPSGEAYLSGKDLLAMDLNSLATAVSEARFFRNLKNTKFKLERTEYCGRHADRALETKEELDQLNLIRNKTTETYGQRAMEVKDENTRAIRDLETCYTAHLSLNYEFKYKRILTYTSLEENYFKLADRYAGINLGDHIDRINKILKMRWETAPFGPSPDEVVGILASVYNSVEVLPGGQGVGWIPVGQGYKLTMQDHLRTGAGSMAGIRFSDPSRQGKVLSTVVKVGSNSHIVMEKFKKAVLGSAPTASERIISLFSGTIHAIKKTLEKLKGKRVRVVPSGAMASKEPQGSPLSIRAGTSMGVIRGTELAVSYDPKTRIADYHLDHGDAYVESRGKQVTLTPRTSRTISNGIISKERPLTESNWSQVLTSTGTGISETMTNSNTSNSELLAGSTSNTNTLLKGTTPQKKIVPTSKIKISEDLVELFLYALKFNDAARLNQTIDGVQKKMMEKNRKNRPLKAWLDENKQRPTRFDIKCTLCEESTCHTLAYVESEADFPGAGKDILFEIKNMGHMPNALRITSTYLTKERITAFRLKSPICRK
jgi:hypothetical protein